jgi:hypothetical protein
MIEKLLLIIVSLVASGIMFYAIKQILNEGVKDELELPLVNCDTSMLDEVRSESKDEEVVV